MSSWNLSRSSGIISALRAANGSFMSTARLSARNLQGTPLLEMGGNMLSTQSTEQGGSNRYKVIIADDLHENRELLRQTIEPEGYDSFLVPSGRVAVELAQKLQPDLIFLDISMPDMGGYEAASVLKQTDSTASIPIIFITASDEVSSLVQAFEAGAVDYIVTPFVKEEVIARLKTHVQLYRLRLELEQEIHRRQQAEKERESARKELTATARQLSHFTKQEARRWGLEGFVGQSHELGKVVDQVRKVHQSNTINVIVTGESGVGKELIARAIHYGSGRASGPFVAINCSSIPKDLAESLLFGHAKGSFSGAVRDQVGYFQMAEGGSLFLDELGELPLNLQSKLLRTLEDGKLLPVGSTTPVKTDVRIIAATNRSLTDEIDKGHFREDLFYRLARFSIHIPPLRERKEDIPLLADHFLDQFSSEMGRPKPLLTPDAREKLMSHNFPGNVRELKNLIERAFLESEGERILPSDIFLIQRRKSTFNEEICPSSTPEQQSPRIKSMVDLELVSEDERTILDHVLRHGRITNSDCRQLLGSNIRRANYLLNRLTQNGHLVKAGANRNAIYLKTSNS